MTERDEISPVPLAAFCGLDVGKSEHHACAVNTAGKRVYDTALPNDETALRTVFDTLAEDLSHCTAVRETQALRFCDWLLRLLGRSLPRSHFWSVVASDS